MNNFKQILGFGLIIAGLAIILIVYTVWTKNPKSESQQTNTTPIEQTNDANESNAPAPASQSVNADGYSFEVPNDLQPAKITETYLPYDNKTIPVSQSYYHQIDVEYCSLSGECVPKTTDFSFHAGIVNSSLSSITAKLGTEAKNETIGRHNVKILTQGAEGEGRNYYFIAMPGNAKTLMFSQKYMDENILRRYKSNPDFIKLEDQNKMMREIIETLKFAD